MYEYYKQTRVIKNSFKYFNLSESFIFNCFLKTKVKRETVKDFLAITFSKIT